jgi:hypothetical protein
MVWIESSACTDGHIFGWDRRGNAYAGNDFDKLAPGFGVSMGPAPLSTPASHSAIQLDLIASGKRCCVAIGHAFPDFLREVRN